MAKPKKLSLPIEQLEIDLPDKKYFTIGEVADLCQLKSHVLRYWEQVFPQLEPSKRRGRRYYQKNDVLLVLEIKSLLHDQGFTIPGAKTRLSKRDIDIEDSSLTSEQATVVEQMQKMQSELKQFADYIKQRF
ncbi:MerR family transcriptional regulator [Thiomicrorhabdus sediminis]|uniref:MerR family transcriptional regulator n=1 Tax=Thiomicrorhabdus sediminis TaxID=2580412 RepID=A0A4P9K841_9GAMM|nr:MerR family transcriptional regulator [Thiomicrorhabdus sediminis]QCU90556.1 MerR family transcriptional regulator [Thiomicrorhabdus sediminis]